MQTLILCHNHQNVTTSHAGGGTQALLNHIPLETLAFTSQVIGETFSNYTKHHLIYQKPFFLSYNSTPTHQEMNSRKTLSFFLFSFFLFPFISLSTSQNGPSAACHLSKLAIRFPFRLNSLQSQSYGYPGFNLSCNSANKTVINLPNSGQFTLQYINYATQQIWINDPNNCLAARVLSLNLTYSPFKGIYHQNFTIFNCSSDYREFKLNPIACLSGLDYTVFATSDEKTVASLSLRCRLVQVVLVPVQWPFDEEIVSSDLDEDLRLGWSSPACGKCESRGEQCGFRSYSSLQVGCLGDPKHGIPRTARYAISAGAGLILMFAVGLLCFLCGRIHSAYNHHGPSPLTDPEIVLQPIAVSGLDEPTIESFPKVVLGQSLRLPKPDSDTCPICLSEYMPKETLRSIPQCQHCFHADCIDEWLRLNPTCPVCRNLPEQAFPNEHLIL